MTKAEAPARELQSRYTAADLRVPEAILGAQGIPVGGFEPTPLNTGAGAGIASSLGAGTLTTIYDPALQETAS